MTKPNTGEYCLEILKGDKDIIEKNVELLKEAINKKYAPSFEEGPPFVIAVSSAQKRVCIKLLKKTKKVVEKIEEINSSLSKGIKINKNLVLGPPTLFNLEQYSWWTTDTKLGEKQKWTSLEHHGPYFPDLEKYTPHKAPLIYEGKEYVLSQKEEKVANFYAKRLISENNPNITIKYTEDSLFNKNFWDDFKGYMTPEHKKIFKDISKADFSKIVEKLIDIKENETQTEKLIKKEEAARKKHEYGYATVNGVKEAVGNFTIEPSGIFLGRGKNPMRGKIKREIVPEDITINIGPNATVPKPPKGHSWAGVINNNKLAWLASWKDPISEENKYIYFAAEGQLKGKSDLYKYEKARKLNKYIEQVRERYSQDINRDTITGTGYRDRQLGTVLYLIDHFGFRVGGDKDEDEADTVGASTLRVEHIQINDSKNIVFDFLGKDSIRFYKKITVPERIVQNVQQFVKNKSGGAMLFDKISAQDINSYLKSFDRYFTAKVFRTRLASVTMYEELKKIKIKSTDKDVDKKVKLDKANAKVAEVLNHKRTVPIKTQEKIKELKKELKDLYAELRQAESDGKKTAAIEKKIDTRKRQIETKSDTLSVAINTSKTNYIDPRIIVSWSKKYNLPINKTYTQTMQKKFSWAINTISDDWDYFDTPLLGDMDKLDPVIDGERPVKKEMVKKTEKKESKKTEKKLDVNLEAVKGFFTRDEPSPNQGYLLNDILAWDNQKLEDKHDYIQTLFPLKVKGMAPSFLLADSVIAFFKSDNLARYNIFRAYRRMMDFYGYSVDISKKNKPNIQIDRYRDIDYLYITHNYKRISRMLQFLYTTDFKLLAYSLLLCLCQDINENPKLKKMVQDTGSLNHWMKALNIKGKTTLQNSQNEQNTNEISDRKRLLTAILSLAKGKKLEKDTILFIGKTTDKFSKYISGILNYTNTIKDCVNKLKKEFSDKDNKDNKIVDYIISDAMKMTDESIDTVRNNPKYFPVGIIEKHSRYGNSEIITLFILGAVDWLLEELVGKALQVENEPVSIKSFMEIVNKDLQLLYILEKLDSMKKWPIYPPLVTNRH